MPHRPPPHHHVPASAISRFIEPGRIEATLAPWLPDEGERAFVVRCILGEGPAHHRGANFALLALLARVLEQVGPTEPPAAVPGPHPGPDVEVPMRVPPHLAREAAPKRYPLRLPTTALRSLVGDDARALEAMVDCLTDGPPHHALANVAMVTLLEAILSRLEGSRER